MARKEIDVTITEDGRDKGKVFVIREMSALQAEKWAARALLALGRAGVNVDHVQGSGLAGIAMLGYQSLFKLSFEDVEPLLDEMFDCISIRPDRAHPQVTRRLINDGGDGDDIEEIGTRLFLRMEVFKLHTDFSLPGDTSTSTSGIAQVPGAPSLTPMSRGQSAQP